MDRAGGGRGESPVREGALGDGLRGQPAPGPLPLAAPEDVVAGDRPAVGIQARRPGENDARVRRALEVGPGGPAGQRDPEGQGRVPEEEEGVGRLLVEAAAVCQQLLLGVGDRLAQGAAVEEEDRLVEGVAEELLAQIGRAHV